MAFLFDFGVSQEDPLSEQLVLELKPGDRVLSVASGGEVPLSLICLTDNLHVTAVDISKAQICLCRMKLIAALSLGFPENGQFLGFDHMKPERRIEIYRDLICQHLTEEEILFWEVNLPFVGQGVINAGRFEQYIAKMRFFSNLLIGKRNLQRLIDCQEIEDQREIFEKSIASRKSLQLLFRVAFHPAVYKKRGLQEKALRHAGKSTGERFYRKFESFCIANLASQNYFLQYFLTGRCQTPGAFPHYLQPQNRQRLKNFSEQLQFETISFERKLREEKSNVFNKIHLSNLGDWMSEEEFSDLKGLLQEKCSHGTILCSRYLQKNQFASPGFAPFIFDERCSEMAQNNDRFPFYTIFRLELP